MLQQSASTSLWCHTLSYQICWSDSAAMIHWLWMVNLFHDNEQLAWQIPAGCYNRVNLQENLDIFQYLKSYCLYFFIVQSSIIIVKVFIPPASTKLKGGYTGITLSVCPSLRLWTESCPLYIFNNTHRIHFIFAHLIKQLQKVCRV